MCALSIISFLFLANIVRSCKEKKLIREMRKGLRMMVEVEKQKEAQEQLDQEEDEDEEAE